MGRPLLLVILLVASAAAQESATVAEGQVPLDDVWCTACHFEQGDEFALSVHYQRGLLLCNDCHGGDPLEADEELAKAPETGFLGKPGRDQVAAICARCHSGPAAFFGMGPHADVENPDNPTCITCHQNHLIVDATLAVMDTTCRVCHQNEPDALARAAAIQSKLHAAERDLRVASVRFDSLHQLDAGLGRSSGLLASASAAVRQLEPRTHALDAALMDTSVAVLAQELAAVHATLDDSVQQRRRRHWLVAGVWLFVAVNIGLLWLKRRQL